ncbi:MAG: pentapeptide repeat-containing protein [Deltaproteobacteria bacterium]|nr:pentapeptide repeat-containing protein [Deltaproteobacteria bacterium]
MLTLDALQAGDAFEDALIDGLDLQGFDFAGKDLVRCTFRNANLQLSRWGEARLEECVFEGCDLSRMVPAEMKAHGVRFKRCKITGVEFSRLSLSPELAFEDCNLRYSSFVDINLRDAPLIRCQALEANFIGVELTGADFSGTELTGSTFEGATLAKADFTSAKGAFLDPAKNKVKGVRVGVDSAVLLASSFGMKVDG